MFMEERNGENESKRTVRAAGTQGRRGSRRGSARTTDGKWQLAAGPLATACGPRPGRERDESCNGGFGAADTRPPVCHPPVVPSARRGSRAPRAALPARAFPLPAASSSALGEPRRAADNLRAALNSPGPKFTGAAPVPLACAPAGLRPRDAVLESSAPGGEKNVPGGRGLNPRGPLSPKAPGDPGRNQAPVLFDLVL